MNNYSYILDNPSLDFKKNIKKIEKILSNEILVKVDYCGICHSDLHMALNDWGMTTFPFVGGHEVVGKIVEIGDQVKDIKTGDVIGIGWQSKSCNSCEMCESDHDNLCSSSTQTIVGRDGGFANYIKVDSSYAFKIPEALKPELAAPLMCAGITVYSPLSKYAKKGMNIAIVGIGGLGHLAVLTAKAMGCNVTAISHSDSKKDFELSLGADNFINSSNGDDLAQAIGSFDFILSTVSSNIDWTAYINALKPLGCLCFVGISTETMNISNLQLVMGEKKLVGSAIGGKKKIAEMLNFMATNNVKPIIELFDITEIKKAFKKLENNELRFRAVLKF